MNHGTASGKLLELAYGELAEREARGVEAHAAGCHACRAELDRIRETRALMAQLPVEPPPEGGERILMAAAREVAEARRARPLFPRWIWAGSAGAVAAVAVAVVSWQLASAPRVATLRDGGVDLLGRPPPPVAAAPEAPSPAAADGEGVAPAKELEAREAVGEAPARRRTSRAAEPPPELAAAPRREEPVAPTAGSATAAPEPSAVWRTAPAEAEPVADAYAPPPAPAPPPAAAMAPRAMAQKARAPAAAERKAAAPVAVDDGLRDEESPAGGAAASGPGSVETRTFAGCPGERRRVVERDGDGRVVRYVRVGELRTVEQRYGADGRLRSALVTEGGARRALPLDAPGLVREARDAGIDAPPRCEP